MTKDFCRLHRKAQTVIIWLANGLTSSDIVFDNVPKDFSLPIAFSTWIRKRAVFLVFIKDVRCWQVFPLHLSTSLVNSCIINFALFLRRSLVRNPLSAIISSLGRKIPVSKNQQYLLMYQPHTFPLHSFETYVMSPDGLIPGLWKYCAV